MAITYRIFIFGFEGRLPSVMNMFLYESLNWHPSKRYLAVVHGYHLSGKSSKERVPFAVNTASPPSAEAVAKAFPQGLHRTLFTYFACTLALCSTEPAAVSTIVTDPSMVPTNSRESPSLHTQIWLEIQTDLTLWVCI